MSKQPHVICLCGSSRFVDVFAVLAWQLEKLGNVVLGLHLLPSWYVTDVPHHLAEAEGVADKMDELHLRKIDMADEVIVIDLDNYIGESTALEIVHARHTHTPLRFVSSEMDLLDLIDFKKRVKQTSEPTVGEAKQLRGIIERARNVTTWETDLKEGEFVEPSDWSGGNVDDAYWAGKDSGRQEFAEELLRVLNGH